jgi:hypothetical protein
MLSAFPAGGCEEAGGDGASEAGLLQALLSIQPQIVDACERAFFQAIQESPVKPGKRSECDFIVCFFGFSLNF